MLQTRHKYQSVDCPVKDAKCHGCRRIGHYKQLCHDPTSQAPVTLGLHQAAFNNQLNVNIEIKPVDSKKYEIFG